MYLMYGQIITYPEDSSIPTKSYNEINFSMQERYFIICQENSKTITTLGPK